MLRSILKSKKLITSTLLTIVTSSFYYNNVYAEDSKNIINNPSSSLPSSSSKSLINKDSLPLYTSSQLSQHKTMESRIWVSHNDLIYDITDFVASHPGGLSKIMLAAGNSVDPFWNIYQQHKSGTTGREVEKILERYLIGRLKIDPNVNVKIENDPYGNDPIRPPVIRPESLKPFNGEPPSPLLMDNYNTPNDVFYIRNHLPVPDIKAEEYRLQVIADGMEPMTYSIDELKNHFPLYKVDATIQCGGNRRGEMIKIKPVKGLNWGASAIGNAEWTGVLLSDILRFSGVSDKLVQDKSLKHIQFEGLDSAAGTNYGASIPIDKCLDPNGDVLIAFEMNGEKLTRDHGYPARIVAPGIVGARSVKFIGKIIAAPAQSSSHWQQKDYKGFNSSVDWDNVKWDCSPAIQDMPVTSAVCEPTSEQLVSLDNDEISLKGYAWSGGGRSIVRVDVSADEGKNWIQAELLPTVTGRRDASVDMNTVIAPPSMDIPMNPRAWSWTQWVAQIPFDEKLAAEACKNNGCNVKLFSRAVDSSYNIQPDSVAPIWNMRGVVNNAWHSVTVKVPNPEKKL